MHPRGYCALSLSPPCALLRPCQAQDTRARTFPSPVSIYPSPLFLLFSLSSDVATVHFSLSLSLSIYARALIFSLVSPAPFPSIYYPQSSLSLPLYIPFFLPYVRVAVPGPRCSFSPSPSNAPHRFLRHYMYTAAVTRGRRLDAGGLTEKLANWITHIERWRIVHTHTHIRRKGNVCCSRRDTESLIFSLVHRTREPRHIITHRVGNRDQGFSLYIRAGTATVAPNVHIYLSLSARSLALGCGSKVF